MTTYPPSTLAYPLLNQLLDSLLPFPVSLLLQLSLFHPLMFLQPLLQLLLRKLIKRQLLHLWHRLFLLPQIKHLLFNCHPTLLFVNDCFNPSSSAFFFSSNSNVNNRLHSLITSKRCRRHFPKIYNSIQPSAN